MILKIPIEILVPGIIFVVFALWLVWYNVSLTYNKRRYKKENDKSRPYKRDVGSREPDVKDVIKTDTVSNVDTTKSDEPATPKTNRRRTRNPFNRRTKN